MPTELFQWTDCTRAFPYRDYEGRWQFPKRTQRRRVVIAGRMTFEYREREETKDEYAEMIW